MKNEYSSCRRQWNDWFCYSKSCDGVVYIIDKVPPKVASDNVVFIEADVTDYESLKVAINSASLNDVRSLVCAAGGALPEEWGTFNLEATRKSIDLNLMGVINCVHAVLHFMERGASITLISSINGKGAYSIPGYSAAKAGLEGFMFGIAKPLAQQHIRINTLCLGTVVTELTLRETQKDWKRLREGTMEGEFTTPEDVADLVKAVSDNKSISCQTIIIDSGQLAKH